MTDYKTRKSNMYKIGDSAPFTLSRSRIDRFLECPKCFYLDRKLGIDRPGMPGWSLNSAVDELLKKEFDILRKEGHIHDLVKEYGLDLVPFQHKDLPTWRDDVHHYRGACVFHKPTNLEICGIIDDVWVDKKGTLYIVDYKSTSTKSEITLDDKYKQGYKKQIEVYQWIFRQLGFKVSDKAYFVFANATKKPKKFGKKLQFDLSLIPYKGDDSWVEPTIYEMKKCLDGKKIPKPGEDCDFCKYREEISKVDK